MVKPVEARYSGRLKRNPLKLAYELLISFRRLRYVTRCVEYRPYLMNPENGISGRSYLQAVRDGCRCNLCHLADLLFKSHPAQNLFDIFLNPAV